MNIYVKILLLTFLTVTCLHLGRMFYILQGYGNDVLPHYPGKCQIVEGFTTSGAEDMTLLPDGKVIITSGLVGFGDYDFKKTIARGAIYLMDPTKGYTHVEQLTIEGWSEKEHFEPHGVHHWVHENKSVSIFIVLHMPETIGRFLYDGEKTLTLTKIYRNPEFMRNINSVFVTGEDSFFGTNLFNARYYTERVLHLLEQALAMPMGSVFYIKGGIGKFVAENLLLSNGIAGNDKYVYLLTKDAIQVYNRRVDNSLGLQKAIPVAIGVMDNINIDAEGDLWIGGMNSLLMTAEHLGNPALPCPSVALRVRDPQGQAVVESVLQDKHLLKCTSVALYTNKKLLMGTVRDQMLSCDVHYLTGK